MNTDVVIRVEKLWKQYGLPLGHAIRRRWKKILRKSEPQKPLWALQDISFELRRGETLGLIGRNGAGKSTLLKVLSGVTPPTRGQIDMQSRVFPMIELNAGINHELTGRENVYLLGAIMGLNRKAMQVKMPDIEAFYGLDEWLDKPVWQYSSGMMARLGFGVAFHVNADILLIDEVLAVGDLAFQRKCLSYIAQRQKEGKAVIFVSHSLRQVQRLCDHVMLLENGICVASGNPSEVVALYEQKSSQQELDERTTSAVPYTSVDEHLIALKRLELLDSEGCVTQQCELYQPMRVRFHFMCGEPLENVSVGIGFLSTDNIFIAGATTDAVSGASLTVGENIVECFVPKLPFRPGVYGLTHSVRGPDSSRLLGSDGPIYFEVAASDPLLSFNSYGLIHLDVNWSFQTPGGAANV